MTKLDWMIKKKKKKVILTVNVESWGTYEDIKKIYEEIGSAIQYDELHFNVKH